MAEEPSLDNPLAVNSKPKRTCAKKTAKPSGRETSSATKTKKDTPNEQNTNKKASDKEKKVSKKTNAYTVMKNDFLKNSNDTQKYSAKETQEEKTIHKMIQEETTNKRTIHRDMSNRKNVKKKTTDAQNVLSGKTKKQHHTGKKLHVQSTGEPNSLQIQGDTKKKNEEKKDRERTTENNTKESNTHRKGDRKTTHGKKTNETETNKKKGEEVKPNEKNVISAKIDERNVGNAKEDKTNVNHAKSNENDDHYGDMSENRIDNGQTFTKPFDEKQRSETKSSEAKTVCIPTEGVMNTPKIVTLNTSGDATRSRMAPMKIRTPRKPKDKLVNQVTVVEEAINKIETNVGPNKDGQKPNGLKSCTTDADGHSNGRGTIKDDIICTKKIQHPKVIETAKESVKNEMTKKKIKKEKIHNRQRKENTQVHNIKIENTQKENPTQKKNGRDEKTEESICEDEPIHEKRIRDKKNPEKTQKKTPKVKLKKKTVLEKLEKPNTKEDTISEEGINTLATLRKATDERKTNDERHSEKTINEETDANKKMHCLKTNEDKVGENGIKDIVIHGKKTGWNDVHEMTTHQEKFEEEILQPKQDKEKGTGTKGTLQEEIVNTKLNKLATIQEMGDEKKTDEDNTYEDKFNSEILEVPNVKDEKSNKKINKSTVTTAEITNGEKTFDGTINGELASEEVTSKALVDEERIHAGIMDQKIIDKEKVSVKNVKRKETNKEKNETARMDRKGNLKKKKRNIVNKKIENFKFADNSNQGIFLQKDIEVETAHVKEYPMTKRLSKKSLEVDANQLKNPIFKRRPSLPVRPPVTREYIKKTPEHTPRRGSPPRVGVTKMRHDSLSNIPPNPSQMPIRVPTFFKKLVIPALPPDFFLHKETLAKVPVPSKNEKEVLGKSTKKRAIRKPTRLLKAKVVKKKQIFENASKAPESFNKGNVIRVELTAKQDMPARTPKPSIKEISTKKEKNVIPLLKESTSRTVVKEFHDNVEHPAQSPPRMMHSTKVSCKDTIHPTEENDRPDGESKSSIAPRLETEYTLKKKSILRDLLDAHETGNQDSHLSLDPKEATIESRKKDRKSRASYALPLLTSLLTSNKNIKGTIADTNNRDAIAKRIGDSILNRYSQVSGRSTHFVRSRQSSEDEKLEKVCHSHKQAEVGLGIRTLKKRTQEKPIGVTLFGPRGLSKKPSCTTADEIQFIRSRCSYAEMQALYLEKYMEWLQEKEALVSRDTYWKERCASLFVKKQASCRLLNSSWERITFIHWVSQDQRQRDMFRRLTVVLSRFVRGWFFLLSLNLKTLYSEIKMHIGLTSVVYEPPEIQWRVLWLSYSHYLWVIQTLEVHIHRMIVRQLKTAMHGLQTPSIDFRISTG